MRSRVVATFVFLFCVIISVWFCEDSIAGEQNGHLLNISKLLSLSRCGEEGTLSNSHSFSVYEGEESVKTVQQEQTATTVQFSGSFFLTLGILPEICDFATEDTTGSLIVRTEPTSPIVPTIGGDIRCLFLETVGIDLQFDIAHSVDEVGVIIPILANSFVFQLNLENSSFKPHLRLGYVVGNLYWSSPGNFNTGYGVQLAVGGAIGSEGEKSAFEIEIGYRSLKCSYNPGPDNTYFCDEVNLSGLILRFGIRFSF